MGPAAFERAPSRSPRVWAAHLPQPSQWLLLWAGISLHTGDTAINTPNTLWTPLPPARAAEAPEGHLSAVEPVSRVAHSTQPS